MWLLSVYYAVSPSYLVPRLLLGTSSDGQEEKLVGEDTGGRGRLGKVSRWHEIKRTL